MGIPSGNTNVDGLNITYDKMNEKRLEAIKKILVDVLKVPSNQVGFDQNPAYNEGNTKYILDFE